MDTQTLYPDLAPLLKGSSFSQLDDLFRFLAFARYSTIEHLRAVNFKLATKPKLIKLVELEYLAVNGQGIYTIAVKVRDYLNKRGLPTELIKTKFTGEGAEHQLAITAVILRDFKELYFVFYPTFTEPPDYKKDFLRPDACLIYGDQKKYKIVFLEVERTDKPNDYLFDKARKYAKVASDRNTYQMWWKNKAEKLRLPYPEEQAFCFSVLCVGNFKAEWEGWNFGTT